MMAATVREMTEADWPAVAAIYQAGMDSGNATFETQCPDWAAWDAGRLAAPRLVAVLGDQVVGWAALSPYARRAVYRGVAEVSIYIAQECTGRGIGRTLLMALCGACDALGFWTLQAGIFRENEPSLRLHAGCGFRTVGIRERLGMDRQGAWRDVVLMERRISP